MSDPRPSSTRYGTPARSTTASYLETGTIISRPRTSGRSTRPGTSRPRTAASTLGVENQEVICAVSESRGVAPTVGLAFVNLDTGEAALSQISDSQTYVRTIHKLMVFNPTIILIADSAHDPDSKLFSIIQDSLDELDSSIVSLNRKYWSETAGTECIRHLAFEEDVDSILTAASGNFYTVCCFAAILKYVELCLSKVFPPRSLRIKYEPPEGSMMIDLSTIRSLELVQNLNDPKSKHSLFGILNHTQTAMGARLLRSNILQPSTNPAMLERRFEALEELTTKEEMFFAVKNALKSFHDADKMLTQLILVPVGIDLKIVEQSINNVIMLKSFVRLIPAVYEALNGAQSDLLQDIRGLCDPAGTAPISELIDAVINEDTMFALKPLELRNQRTYAVVSGCNGLLDVARQTYKEAMSDAFDHITALAEEHGLGLQTKYDNARHFFLRMHKNDLEVRTLPDIFINVVRKAANIEFTTLELMQRNQKVADAHSEVIMMSDKTIQDLINDVRGYMAILFKTSEAIAMLDMLSSFGQSVTTQNYHRPSIHEDTLTIQHGRHPIREVIQSTKFIPNDVFASQQFRFHILTGCNMSGKSTYIRSVALMAVMAQIGCFVPADNATFPILYQLFARVSMDDSIEANVSTFAAEMREMAFILRNIDRRSMAIIDELGRGTSTRDGLAIALAIAEALVDSKAFVWFTTHFRELAAILEHRPGVKADYMQVEMSADKMQMLYRLASGTVQETHYGLALAKAVVPLPPDLIAHAEEVSYFLEQQGKDQKKHSLTVMRAKRRKLLLNLKEHLVRAKQSTAMNDQALKKWLQDLQMSFVIEMEKLDTAERDILEGKEEENGASTRASTTMSTV